MDHHPADMCTPLLLGRAGVPGKEQAELLASGAPEAGILTLDQRQASSEKEEVGGTISLRIWASNQKFVLKAYG